VESTVHPFFHFAPLIDEVILQSKMCKMKTRITIIFLLSISLSYHSWAQFRGQVIRGSIVDQQSKEPLPGANVVIVGSTPPIGASADANGQFRISNVKSGRYDLKASFIGYEESIISSVVVTTGKEVVLEISLNENVRALKEVEISGYKKHETINGMTSVSARSFTMEEAGRYSGGRSDPSRLVSNFAGVSTPNDSRNDIVIRGNSPAGVLWRIDGMTIPNPNHFVNMGTTGGPVSALNPNTLDNSDFLTSAWPAYYGNANGGVFDIRLRTGNNEKREYTIEMGALTGLEAVAEGPVVKGKNASYMAAYRYSFTGLSQQLGIPIGTSATPFYQDLTFKITSGDTKAGRFTLFGLGGLSHIQFKHDKIDTTDIFVDPNMDTYSGSTIGMMGLSHFIRLSKKVNLNNIVGISYTNAILKLDSVQPDDNTYRIRNTNTTETRILLNSYVDYKANPQLFIKAGIQADVMLLDLKMQDRINSPEWIDMLDFDGVTTLLAGYAESRYRITEKLTLNAGFRSQYLTLNKSLSAEPRVGIRYQFHKNHSIRAGYGYHVQMQTLPVYFYRELLPDGTYDESNQNLGFTHAQHFVIGWDANPFPDWRIKAEGYYQYLSKVPVSKNSNSFSMLNQGASFNMTEESNLINNGTGTNYGAELTIEKFFSRGYYALATCSFYQAKYRGSDEVERNTGFNGNYAYNILAGKEFKIGKEKQNAITLDIKFSQAGGRYYTPIDLEASRAAGEQVLMGDDYAFSERYPGFLRLDIKGGITLNSKKRNFSQTFFIDIQNVTNNKNVFMVQYNSYSGEIGTLYQIGFFPNFGYKIQF
jgi:hypothetical protein